MTDASPTWDPEQYRRYEAERDRPALDLLLRLPSDLQPREIWDLGCGAGQHAALLKRRHPAARVHGLDLSAEMLEQARALSVDVDWRLGGIADWRPDRPADLIFSNAALQWLTGHETLIPRLAEALAPGGMLAIQAPLANGTLHHRVIAEVVREEPWAGLLADARPVSPLLAPEVYYDLLAGLCDGIDIWATTYQHVLGGEDPVLEWVKGTALRPYLTRLTDPEMRAGFLSGLGERLRAAFPVRADGSTLLPFPRLFLVARRRFDGGDL
jgi:trans-aconitate 2-methyltransferase